MARHQTSPAQRNQFLKGLNRVKREWDGFRICCKGLVALVT